MGQLHSLRTARCHIWSYADVCHQLLLQVTAHVSDAVSKGAKVLVGGQVPELPEPLSNGHFYAPTVLAEATIDM